jgi:hypothetical protein
MIVFTKGISETNVLLAYVNNVVEFSSNNVLIPKRAVITIGSSVKTIYPNPSGVFYFNFKQWITSIINTDNLKDDINLDINNGYIYDWGKMFLSSAIDFKIIFTNNSEETTTKNTNWLLATTQLEHYKTNNPIDLQLNKPFLLSPTMDLNNNAYYIKYWEGFPFDIPFYNGTETNILVSNESNLLNYTFTTISEVNRLLFSDGSITITIDDVLSLADGYNKLKLTSNQLDFYIDLEKQNGICEGHYFKWLNEKGGYNYWLFPKGNRNRKIKDLGELKNDFYNLSDTISPAIQLGKQSNDVLMVSSDILTSEQNDVLSGILDSPKIYYFTGQPFAKASYNDWIEVSLNVSDARVINAKQHQNKYNLSFEFPQRNTITI